MQLAIRPDGTATAIYGEEIQLDAIGETSIRRASHVEPSPGGGWLADMSPVSGPVLGPFPRRSDALAAEMEWLSERLAELDS